MIKAGLIRLSYRGTSPGGEIFNFSIFTEPSTPPADADALESYAASAGASIIDAGMDTFYSELLAVGQSMQEVRAYFYGNGGSRATLVSSVAAIRAGTGTGKMPLQCAVVASLRTALAGRSNRGRIYLPASGAVGFASVAQLTPQIPQDIANAIADHLETLKAPASPYPAQTPVIASSVRGTATPIWSVVVNSVVDTQRRRSNRLTPATTYEAAVS